MARPTVFEPAHIETARAMSFGGATDREVAEYLSVDESTVHRWKHEHPEFGAALTTGKAAADRRVEHSLYRKAVGYSFDSEKIFHHEGVVTRVPLVEHVPPSDTAAIFWLKNRNPEQYREKTEVEVNMKYDLAAEIAKRRARVAEEGATDERSADLTARGSDVRARLAAADDKQPE